MKIRVWTAYTCFALAMIAALASPILASPVVGGIPCVSNNECIPGELCGRAIGACNRGGACAAQPIACVNVFDPVCGCDGQTFDNECQAAVAGVSVAALGPCEAMGCVGDSDCPGGFFCRKAAGACGGKGLCANPPAVCNVFMYAPVCGCNGKTYDNTCLAAQAGVNVVSMGACPGHRCEANAECGANEYCMRPGKSCLGAGHCEQRPELCYDLYAPVCGCDGQVYPNSCFAAMNGASVASAGEVCQ